MFIVVNALSYNLLVLRHTTFSAIACRYGEANDRSENSDFLLLRQRDPLGKLLSEIYFKNSSEFIFLWNLGKYEIQLNQPKWPMKFTQNCTFSTGQYRKTTYSHSLQFELLSFFWAESHLQVNMNRPRPLTSAVIAQKISNFGYFFKPLQISETQKFGKYYLCVF